MWSLLRVYQISLLDGKNFHNPWAVFTNNRYLVSENNL